MPAEFALAACEHQSMSYVVAVKIFEGAVETYREACQKRFPGFEIEKSFDYAIVRNFPQEEMNAN